MEPMKPTLFRSALGGATFTLVFSLILTILRGPVISLSEALGIAVLALGLFMIIIIIGWASVALGAGIFAARFILRTTPMKHRFYILFYGVPITIAVMVTLNYVNQQLPGFLTILATAVVSAAVFCLLSIFYYSSSSTNAKKSIPILVIIGLIGLATLLQTYGTTTAQTDAMKKSDLVYYIPNSSIEGIPKASKLFLLEANNDTEQSEIQVQLDDNSNSNRYHRLHETKLEANVNDSNCTERTVEEIESKAQNEPLTCSIVFREGDTTIYHGWTGYFAHVGTMRISTTYSDRQYGAEASLKILKNLIPLEEKDYSKYSARTTPNPLPFLF